jgi:sugar phosphate isomerase/epimerase
MVFDYSHFIFREMPMPELIRESLPYTAHIAVKDAELRNGKVQFSLPGESKTIDYVDLLKRFYGGGYRGDVCVEVSGQVWKKTGYEPKQTAKICYRNLQRAFVEAKVERPS